MPVYATRYRVRGLALFCLMSLLAAPALAAGGFGNINVHVNVQEPPPCKLLNGGTIKVDFGAVTSDQVDGDRYTMPLGTVLDCSHAARKTAKLQFSGAGAPFNAAVLGTTGITDLGIKLMQNGRPLDLGSWLNFSTDVIPPLSAVLVTRVKNEKLSTGRFSAQTTLTVEYQ